MPFSLARCAELLQGSTVKPSTTVGFPHGVQSTSVKIAEAEQALAEGCAELDMVINISRVLSGKWSLVRDEIRLLTELTHSAGQKIKVIFENCYLQDDHKIRLCEICGDLNVDWVKTSTGFGTSGSTMDDLRLMRRHSPPNVQIKASGGIRSFDDLLAIREIGVTRVGTSKTIAILNECRMRLSMPPIELPKLANAG